MRADHNTTRRTSQPSSLKPVFVGALLGLVLMVLGLVIPSPYVIEKPGIVVNTLGDIVIDGEEQPVIQFDGAAPKSGATLNLLTVAIVGSPDDRLGWLEVIPALINPRQELVPLSQMFPEGQTSEERDTANQAMMQHSHLTATAAALNTLDVAFETEVTVEDVVEDSPANGQFVPGDIITRVDGASVTGMGMVREAVLRAGEGQNMTFSVLRDGDEHDLSVRPALHPLSSAPYIGVVMASDYSFPHEITFDVDRIGGPSAGMMFSLAIVEELGGGELVGDTIVSGTGTVDDSGAVGAIGGLTQKIWAADDVDSEVFLMPVGNCGSLPDRLPDDMAIVPVATLDEAVAALEAHSRGELKTDTQRCQTELAQVAPVG